MPRGDLKMRPLGAAADGDSDPSHTSPRSAPPQQVPVALPRASDEQALVAAVLRKDRKAAATFVSAYADPVYAYVRRRLRPREDLVDDVVQEVFLSALDGLHAFRGAASLKAWLLGIARHKVEDYYRDRLKVSGSLADQEDAEPVTETPVVDDIIDRSRMVSRTQQVLTLLPERYRVVLLWRYWDGRSAREMAAATGKTEKAVERLLARARMAFKEFWEHKRGD